MKNRFYADPIKFGISLGTIIVCAALCLLNLIRGDLRGFLFLIPALPFFYVGALYGTIVEVDSEKIVCRRFGRIVRTLAWQEIAETGVVGTKVFNRGNPEKTGSMYIYFSPVRLDEDSRFQMALKWPPKEQVYVLYTKERMDAIRPLWSEKVLAYNTGSLENF